MPDIVVPETNKATVEVPSPATGRAAVFVARNDEVKDGALLLTLEV